MIFAGKTIDCCMNCTERCVNCHSTCTKYIEQKKARDDEKEQLREIKEKELNDKIYSVKLHDRWMKHKRKHRGKW